MTFDEFVNRHLAAVLRFAAVCPAGHTMGAGMLGQKEAFYAMGYPTRRH